MKIDKSNVLNRIKSIREQITKNELIESKSFIEGHFHESHVPISSDLPELINQHYNKVSTADKDKNELSAIKVIESIEGVCQNDAEAILQKLRNSTKSNKHSYSIN